MELRKRIVYLDNSHLHLLSELRRNDASRFAAFMEVWSAKRCELALSQTHLSEINRYDDQAKRDARYDLLEVLTPIHSDLPIGDVPEPFLLLVNREIFRALIKKQLLAVEGESLAKFENAFPQQLTSKDDITVLKALSMVDVYRKVLDAFYEANRVGALANSRAPQTKYERHRLSEIPDGKIDPNLMADLLPQLEEGQTSVKNLDVLRDLVTPAQIDEIFGGIRNSIHQFVKRTEEVGTSSALAEFLGSNSKDSQTNRKPIDLLISEYGFDFCVRRFLTDLGIADEATLDNLSRQIQLEDCPGSWLKNAVQLQMRKAAPIDNASNYYDLEHLSFLPYVDALFADKRIATFARQVLSSDHLPASLQGLQPPICISNSIDSIEAAICSIA